MNLKITTTNAGNATVDFDDMINWVIKAFERKPRYTSQLPGAFSICVSR
jgi:hypothetical protein